MSDAAVQKSGPRDPSRRVTPIDTLTSLRFFAACYVLAFHSGTSFVGSRVKLPQVVTNIFLNGYLGVTFFFLLSGFILAYVYHEGLTDRTSIAQYGAARIGRIFPVYLLTLVAEIILKGFHGWADIPQFFLLQCWGPEKSRIFSNDNGPAWTLSVELFFYFALPFVLALFAKTRKFTLPIIGLAVLMVAVQGPGTPSHEGYPYPGLDSVVPIVLLRLPEFILGVCMGLRFLRGPALSARAANGLLIASLVIIAAALCISQSSFSGSVASVGFAGLIYSMAAANRYQSVNSLLRSNIMIFLGRASFSLYILQEPVHDYLLLVTPSRFVEQMLFYPVLFAVACLVHVFYEENARRFIRSLIGGNAPVARTS